MECQGDTESKGVDRVLRGALWSFSDSVSPSVLAVTDRQKISSTKMRGDVGFRIVVNA
jgi:hypothetical protein